MALEILKITKIDVCLLGILIVTILRTVLEEGRSARRATKVIGI